MNARRGFCVLAVLPLVMGGLLYVCFRPSSLLLFEWANAIGLEHAVSAVRATAAPYSAVVPSWAVNSAPAGLWAMSLMATMTLIWRDELGPQAWGWLAVAAGLACGSELLQLSGHFPGTFDLIDLAAYALGVLGGLTASLDRPSTRSTITETQ